MERRQTHCRVLRSSWQLKFCKSCRLGPVPFTASKSSVNYKKDIVVFCLFYARMLTDGRTEEKKPANLDFWYGTLSSRTLQIFISKEAQPLKSLKFIWTWIGYENLKNLISHISLAAVLSRSLRLILNFTGNRNTNERCEL